MAPTAQPGGGVCTRLAVAMTDLGLVHWQRQDAAPLHYMSTEMSTEAAVRARQSASEERRKHVNHALPDLVGGI